MEIIDKELPKKQSKNVRNFAKELKIFVIEGNMINLAVAVVIGSAFNSTITSLVKDVVTPIIGLVFNIKDFTSLVIGPIQVGTFLNNLINLLLIIICVYFVIKQVNKLKGNPTEEIRPFSTRD